MSSEPHRRRPDDAGRILVDVAREAITDHLDPTRPRSARGTDRCDGEPWLLDRGAAFVTLRQEGRLRGCIGTLEAHRPLIDDVRGNAVSAAVGDPRFPRLTTDELPATSVEVSVLSVPEPLLATTREQVVAALRPHVDGVILESGRHRATFLPQVWDQLPHPEDFLDHLVVKARLPRGHWSDSVRISTYTVTAWEETTPGGDVRPVHAGP